MTSQSRADIMKLVSADSGELYSLLGAAVLSIDCSPSELLEAGRAGAFYATGPAVLGSGAFDHAGLRKAAEAFLARWGVEIRKAVCGKTHLVEAEKKEAIKQVDVWVATLVATLTASIPALGPFTVVLNVLAVIILRSGLSAFCSQILPSDRA
jgi:hypothetical protein